MNGYPGFGLLLGRLLDYRELDVRDLAGLAGIPEQELRAVLGDARPGPSLLLRLARALGLHAADLFVIARMPIPEELAPLDSRAGLRAPSLAQDAANLPPESRRQLLEFARSLPQQDRTQPVPEPEPYERYPPGFGGMLLRMSGNRNLNLVATAETLARLTKGRVYLSASTVGLMGRGLKEVTPGLLAGFAVVLGIPASALAALADIHLPADVPPADPAAADAGKLIWELRRLTAEQVQQVRSEADSMRAR